ncbi:MAG: hypothetical protein ACTHOH_13630 [Lysobacteraceae bacterium]
MRSIFGKSILIAAACIAPAAVAAVSWWSATVDSDGRAPESMRGELASDIVKTWSAEAGARHKVSPQAWSAQMTTTLRQVDMANLERAAGAPTLDGMQAALLGASTARRAGAPTKLGAPGADLVYTPLAPCRIVDTRLAGGPIATSGSRSFLGYSASGFALQGGDAGDCGIPQNASALQVKLTASRPVSDGYFTAYPSGIARPLTSSLNYFAAKDTSNSETISLCRPGCATQFSIFTFAQSDAVIDVVGYYMEPVATALDCTVAQQTGNLDLLGGLQTRSVSCPAGYAAASGGCGGPLGIGISNSQPVVTGGQPTGWRCDLVGSLLSVISYQVSATCCRTAGR